MAGPARRTARPALVAAVVAAAATAGALVTPAAADSATGDAHILTRQAVEAAVHDGVPGVVVRAREEDGTWSMAVGMGDLRTGRERLAQDRYRIGSVSKSFVATVVLQLEAEGRLSLDDTVDRWLPGLVRGNGNDGRRITLRQLLGNTSGLFNYGSDEEFAQKNGEGFPAHRYDTWTPRQLVDTALRHEPRFEPGTAFDYSNTNYILAGMVIEKVTGRPYAAEIERRILRPLGLRATSLPGTDPRMPSPSSRGYSKLGSTDPDAKVHDVTGMNPSSAGSAGEMISDSADVERIYRALLKGVLLPPRQMKEMTTTVPVDPAHPEFLGYGLGLVRVQLSCGKVLWGDGAGITGSLTKAWITREGGHSVVVNFNADWSGAPQEAGMPIVEAEFCR